MVIHISIYSLIIYLLLAVSCTSLAWLLVYYKITKRKAKEESCGEEEGEKVE